MKSFVLEGNNIRDETTFYDEVGRVLCPGFQFGRNLDAVYDVLVGGLCETGIEYQTRSVIIWRDSSISKKAMDPGFYDRVYKILSLNGHELKLE